MFTVCNIAILCAWYYILLTLSSAKEITKAKPICTDFIYGQFISSINKESSYLPLPVFVCYVTKITGYTLAKNISFKISI
jgi:hypothetical protein